METPTKQQPTITELNNARELLHDDLEDGEQAKADLLVVSEFVAAFPYELLNGQLRRIAASQGDEKADAAKRRVENASPVQIFQDDRDFDGERRGECVTIK